MADAIKTLSRETGEERFHIGNFELLRDENDAPLLLGKGAFGRTYKARHRFLDTVVALKVINERYVADPVARQRFLVEGRAVARLSHPHIARIHDFGEAGGALYYAMEFCSGGNLAGHVQLHGALDVAALLDVAIQVAGALECAHAAGFVHRDVKPSNIMLTGPNQPLCTKLIDFGLVHATAPGESVVPGEEDATARFIGTPLFASPEQLREQPVDGRTDLFSLGMTLWYLAVGGAPEPGTPAEIAASRLSLEIYAPRLPKNLPDPLRLLLARLLEKDPDRRVKDVGEALSAFRQCAASLGLPVPDGSVGVGAAGGMDGSAVTPILEEPGWPPAEVRSVAWPMESEWSLLSRGAVAITGSYYSGEHVASSEKAVLAHVLHPELVHDAATFGRIRVNVAGIRSLAVPSVIRPDEIIRYSDHDLIVMGKPSGGDLPAALRAQGVVGFGIARPFLETVAAASDRLRAANLPGLDASSTMTSDIFNDAVREEDPCCQFAGLIYRVVSGRNCPVAASLSPQGFVAVPGLSEQANRILALVIARQSHYASCGDLLQDLLGVEGGFSSTVGSQGTVGSTGTRPVVRSAAATASKSPVAPLRPVAPPILQPSKSEVARKPRGRRLVISTVLAIVALGVCAVFFTKSHTDTTNSQNNKLPGTVHGSNDQSAGTTPNKPTDAKTITEEAERRAQKVYQEGLRYYYGSTEGITIDHARAAALFRQAADQQLPEAEARMAVLYFFGNGVAKDETKAREWANKAIEHGLETKAQTSNPRAEAELAVLYENGLGVSQSDSKAADFYQKAGDGGDAAALNSLSSLYRDGKGVPQNLTKAADLCQRAVAQGNTAALTVLGWLYANGQGVPQSDSKAAELFQKAVDLGDADALTNLGVLYANGRGVAQNYSKAAELFQKTANLDDAAALTNLAGLYADGKGVPRNDSKAAELYQKAADLGFVPAQFALGMSYLEGKGMPKNDFKAAELFQKAADQGFALAQFNLGVFYLNGKGVPMNDSKAAELFQKAADQGDANAQNSLGGLYENGLGVPQNHLKAAELYQKSADQGFASAQHNLALLYENGTGQPQNYSKAAELFQKAADQGIADAQTHLGTLYCTGKGVPQNFSKAAEFFQKAADQGLLFAQHNLGVLYEEGRGVPQNYTKAAELFQKAIDQGFVPSMTHLGFLYENGTGVPQNLSKAAELFQKAADQGDAGAQNNLGLIYHGGLGVARNDKQALVWFQKAADQGLVTAKANLASFRSTVQGPSTRSKPAPVTPQRQAPANPPATGNSLRDRTRGFDNL